MSAPIRLTPMKRAWVAAWAGGANATEAARIAGYKHPQVAGPRLAARIKAGHDAQMAELARALTLEAKGIAPEGPPSDAELAAVAELAKGGAVVGMDGGELEPIDLDGEVITREQILVVLSEILRSVATTANNRIQCASILLRELKGGDEGADAETDEEIAAAFEASLEGYKAPGEEVAGEPEIGSGDV